MAPHGVMLGTCHGGKQIDDGAVGDLAQLGERLPCTHRSIGSSPLASMTRQTLEQVRHPTLIPRWSVLIPWYCGVPSDTDANLRRYLGISEKQEAVTLGSELCLPLVPRGGDLERLPMRSRGHPTYPSQIPNPLSIACRYRRRLKTA